MNKNMQAARRKIHANPGWAERVMKLIQPLYEKNTSYHMIAEGLNKDGIECRHTKSGKWREDSVSSFMLAQGYRRHISKPRPLFKKSPKSDRKSPIGSTSSLLNEIEMVLKMDSPPARKLALIRHIIE